MILYCATTNSGKLAEFRLAAGQFGEAGFQVEGIEGIPPCEESGTTFEENAAQKAVYYSRHAPGLLFADDSGLEVNALGGAPGVYSARFAGPGATDQANNRFLLDRLAGQQDRQAQFVCVVALARQGRLIRTFRAAAPGRILEEPRGAAGFGYDPLFLDPLLNRTFAELNASEKLSRSHRGQALRQMFGYLARPVAVAENLDHR